ncbi:uncharacterized protein TNCV_2208071 [Trichonephila clavipes]|uniref:Uncharacterized protein n=1 Tax=Trichonephila clavipes TaxID=2585209 RepID=A0A8X6V5A9_TRICX|nr:uncharacterized protein TNCV_2208071 [Trichonephila clavipes]
MIGKLEDWRSLTCVAEEFGINKSVFSRAWKAFQIIGTIVRKIGGALGKQLQWMTYISSCSRKEPDTSQQASLLSNCVQQVLWFTASRRLHKGGLLTRPSERCIPFS